MSSSDRITCPHCRQSIKRPPLPPGASCLCPKCNQPFSISVTGEPTAPPANPPRVALAPKVPVADSGPVTARQEPRPPEQPRPPERPVATATVPPPPAKPVPAKPARPNEFSFHCYLCGSLLYARVDQAGTKIQCHDCHAENEVRKPRPEELRAAPQGPTLDDAEDYAMSEPVERPKFSPIEKPRPDDDEEEDKPFQLKPLPVTPTQAVASSSGASQPGADTGMVDLFSQHGGAPQIQNPPPRNPPPVSAPVASRPAAAIPVAPTQRPAPMSSGQHAATHPAPINAPRPATTAAPPKQPDKPPPRIRQHEDTYGDELWSDAPDPNRPAFWRSPFLVGILEFLLYPETLVRWLTLVALATIPIAVIQMAAGAMDSSYSLFSPGVLTLLMFAALTGIPWLAVFGSHAMSIVEDTGRGCDAVEHWPLGGIVPRGNPIYLPVSFVLAMLPGFLFYLTRSDRSVFGPMLMLVSAMLFTPLLWLPMLLEKSVQGPTNSPTFWQSFKFSASGWIVFYLQTLVLALFACGGMSLWSAGSIVIAPLSAVILITPLFIYLRLVGRLLWYIDPAMAPPPPVSTKPPPAPLPETVDPMTMKRAN